MSNLQMVETNSMKRILDKEVVQHFAQQLIGNVILPGDTDYDKARAVWNGMIDKYPAIIVRCAATSDVIAAIQFARDHELTISVRGGGHNVAGSAVCDDGLVIDLSPMKRIAVDPSRRTARVQAGVTWGELDRTTQIYNLAAPGGVVSDTGVAGLTLGGGLGWLRRKYGLSSDNLLSVDIVTADGRLLKASETENADLFWGVRGSGGNFGVVTSFEFQLHPVGPEVMVCFVFHPGEQAREALQFYRQYAAQAPDEVSSFAILGRIPPTEHFPQAAHGKEFVLFAAVYAGSVQDGETAFKPLREFSTPIVDLSGVMPYVEAQSALFDADYPAHEMRYYWKSTYLNALSDEAIDKLIALQAENPSGFSTIDIWQLGGAMSRVAPDATAFGSRSAPFLIGIEANWVHPEQDTANISWNRKVYRELQPYSNGSEYQNFPGLLEDRDAIARSAFGSNYQRLVELKNKYDPTNLFSLNPNIKPSL